MHPKLERSQALQLFTTKHDLYYPRETKGNLDIFPYHIRMQIYRIHIHSTHDASVLAIKQ
jgi:hypothetical protein